MKRCDWKPYCWKHLSSKYFIMCNENRSSLFNHQSVVFQNAYITSANPRGCHGRDPLPLWGPNSFIFMQFSGKKLQNNRLAHPLWELARPPPPEENPGLVTTLDRLHFNFVFIGERKNLLLSSESKSSHSSSP